MERRLFVSTAPARTEVERIKNELSVERNKYASTKRDLSLAIKRSESLSTTLECRTHLYREQIKQHVRNTCGAHLAEIPKV